MREAGQIVRKILNELKAYVRPGVQTFFFEDLSNRLCLEYDVLPAFKNYQGFPFALCCSVNEQVVHGFPSERILEEGDIVSFDFGVLHKGFYGDAAITVPVGEISPEVERLLIVTEESLKIGTQQIVEGKNLLDISAAVQKYVETNGYSVVRRFVGHGIGRSLHEKPEVPNYVYNGCKDVPLRAGMVLAVEPMVTLGGPEVEVLSDNWTAITRDGSWAAHFEQCVALTSDGPIILNDL